MRQVFYDKYSSLLATFTLVTRKRTCSQQLLLYDEEDPPGDDNYIQAGGEDGTRSSRRPQLAQQQQLPRGSRFPPPPTWTPAPAQQHVTPPKVKLPPFWPKDPNSWFTLAESTFNRHNVVDSRLRFDLVQRL